MISGPVKFDFKTGNIDRSAMAFWCVMMERSIFDNLGLLDEIFSPGMGEDGDFCIKAQLKGHDLVQVPKDETHLFGAKTGKGAWSTFPIMHKGSGTFGWLDAGGLIERNKKILDERYGSSDSEFIKNFIGNTNMVKYSVVIPTYNHCDDLLKPCLESIKTFTDLSTVEIIVVANGCTDNTKEYVESLGEPFKLIWSDEAIGYTKATNLGIKAAIGEYVVLLNNDTILLNQQTNDWLNILEAPFLAKKTVGLTGPLELYDDYADSPVLIFFCVMVKREVFQNIGYLDEVFTPGGGEDIDFTVRARLAGYDAEVLAPTQYNGVTNVGTFPIWHKNNQTFVNIPVYTKWIVKRNGLINCLRYNKNIKLDLGRGGKILPHFLTVDNYNPEALVVMDYRTLDQFKDNSVTEIVAYHLIDRINPYHLEDILKNWCRTLKPGGKLVIEVPNVEELFNAYTNSRSEAHRTDILNHVYGYVNYEGVHYTPRQFGWWPHALVAQLQNAGYTNIIQVEPKLGAVQGNFRLEAIKPEGWVRTPSRFEVTDFSNALPFLDSAEEIKNFIDSKSGPIKLNLGSGGIEYDGYISVDAYDTRAQLHSDLENFASALPDNYVDEILASHVFEHLNPHNVKDILTGWLNVLKPGGKLVLEIPNIEQLCLRFKDADWGKRFGILNAVYGSVNTHSTIHQDNITSPHLYNYSPSSLGGILSDVGFVNIVTGQEHIPHPESNFRIEAYKFSNNVQNALPIIDFEKLQIQEPISYNEVIVKNNYAVLSNEVEDKIVIDIGANLGIFSLYCVAIGAKHCICVEAEPTIFSQGLKPNVSPYSKWITPLNYAVFDKDNSSVNIYNKHVASHITNQPTDGVNVNTVPTITLATLIKDIPLTQQMVLKMDCEGSEYDILLNSSADTLRRFDIIYIEMHENCNENPEYRDNELLRQVLRDASFQQAFTSPLIYTVWDGDRVVSTELKNEVIVEKWIKL